MSIFNSLLKLKNYMKNNLFIFAANSFYKTKVAPNQFWIMPSLE